MDDKVHPQHDPYLALFNAIVDGLVAEENLPPDETEHDKQLRLMKARKAFVVKHGL